MAEPIQILLSMKELWDWMQDSREDLAKAEDRTGLQPAQMASATLAWNTTMGGVLLTVLPAAPAVVPSAPEEEEVPAEEEAPAPAAPRSGRRAAAPAVPEEKPL